MSRVSVSVHLCEEWRPRAVRAVYRGATGIFEICRHSFDSEDGIGVILDIRTITFTVHVSNMVSNLRKTMKKECVSTRSGVPGP